MSSSCETNRQTDQHAHRLSLFLYVIVCVGTTVHQATASKPTNEGLFDRWLYMCTCYGLACTHTIDWLAARYHRCTLLPSPPPAPRHVQRTEGRTPTEHEPYFPALLLVVTRAHTCTQPGTELDNDDNSRDACDCRLTVGDVLIFTHTRHPDIT